MDWQTLWYSLIAVVTAGVVTFLDVDNTFYIPDKVEKRLQLWSLVLSFVLANGLLAGCSYWALKDSSLVKDLPEWGKSLAIGLSYLSLVKQKFANISTGGSEEPFGLEFFYNSAKYSVYKRINRIAKQARRLETQDLANNHDLDELLREAELSVRQDALLSSEEKRQKELDYIRSIYNDVGANDKMKALTLADYILSRQ